MMRGEERVTALDSLVHVTTRQQLFVSPFVVFTIGHI